MKHTSPAEYNTLVFRVKERIRSAQYEALKAVNRELISLYWDLGRLLSDRRKGGWGKSVVETLAGDLHKEFPGISGFSAQNLWRMKQFHEATPGMKNSHPW